MSKSLEGLITLFSLEEIEDGIYRGQSQDLGFQALYGGQVLGQAVAAAQKTVLSEQVIHSIHSYFILPGDASRPVIYQIDNVRDGRSFCTRRVKAIQHGREIFIMIASFQFLEPGLDHQIEAPDVPAPEALGIGDDVSLDEQSLSFNNKIREEALALDALDYRPVDYHNWSSRDVINDSNKIWLKTKGMLPDRPDIHYSTLAYISDFNFLATALIPHGETYLTSSFKMATIDHSIWFHRPFKLDDWLLYVMDSPSATNGRGLVRGNIYNRQGDLVASAMQEGLIRKLK